MDNKNVYVAYIIHQRIRLTVKLFYAAVGIAHLHLWILKAHAAGYRRLRIQFKAAAIKAVALYPDIEFVFSEGLLNVLPEQVRIHHIISGYQQSKHMFHLSAFTPRRGPFWRQ